MYTLHDILVSLDAGNTVDPGLRMTVHTLSSDARELVQVLNYVGNERSSNQEKKARRLIPISCGITGRAYRNKKAAMLRRADDNYGEYIRTLKEDQGFTEEQARKLDPSTMSAYAFPLVNEGVNERIVEGIVYLDSTDPDFFTDTRREVISMACAGIARFVKKKSSV